MSLLATLQDEETEMSEPLGGQSMSMQSFINLVKDIRDHYGPFSTVCKGRCVKYIDPVIDMRTLSVFAVSFRGFGFDQTFFNTTNENRDLPDSLETRIRAWLDEK